MSLMQSTNSIKSDALRVNLDRLEWRCIELDFARFDWIVAVGSQASNYRIVCDAVIVGGD